MIVDMQFLQEFYHVFFAGVVTTLQIAFFGSCLGITLGTILGVVLTKNMRFLTPFVSLYVVIIRGTPMLIQIAGTFYLLKYAGVSITAFWSAIISIGLNSGAYVSQIIVSGINSVSKGQIEAAKTLGLTSRQTTFHVVLPQAIRTVLPAFGNEFVTLVKDSSLASTIGVYELTKQGEIVMSQTFDAPAVFVTIGCIYLVMTTVVSLIISHFEKRLQYHAKR